MKKVLDFLRDNLWFDFLLALGLVQAALAACKLLGKIAWRWLWVLTPTWGLVLLCITLVVLCIFCMSDDWDTENGDV